MIRSGGVRGRAIVRMPTCLPNQHPPPINLTIPNRYHRITHRSYRSNPTPSSLRTVCAHPTGWATASGDERLNAEVGCNPPRPNHSHCIMILEVGVSPSPHSPYAPPSYQRTSFLAPSITHSTQACRSFYLSQLAPLVL